MVEPVSKRPSTQEVLNTLAWMRARGIKPVPVHYASKAATSRDYAQPNYSPPDDSVWLNSQLNIGALLGPANGGPVDVDLDCDEAIFFAPYFLPPTPAIFGRKSKQRSHYLYRVASPTMAKVAYNDPVKDADGRAGTLLEIRADGGHQSVFPGSVHETSKEVIAWSGAIFPEIPTVDDIALIKAVKNVAVASLIARHIWLSGQRNECVKHLAGMFGHLEWSEDDAIAMVRAVQAYHGDEDKTRILTVSATYKKLERGAKVTGAPSLRKFLGDARVVDRLLDLAGSPTINLVQEYNAQYAVVDYEGKYRVVKFSNVPSEPPMFYQIDDFVGLNSTDMIEMPNGKEAPKARVWLASSRRRQYNTVDFMPGVDDAPDTLNLWGGWAVKPDESADCSAWTELLKDIVCGGDEPTYQWMLHWFANILREPMHKSMTAPVLIGVQGAGKSLLIGYFGKVLGQGYTVITNDEQITGKFNRHLATTLLLHSEEALFGGDKKHRGIIKSLITDEYRMLEPKGVDAKRIKNYLRLILASNEPHAAPAESNDRRFTVIDMKQRKLSTSLRDRVLKEMRGTGPAALFHMLTTMEYDPHLPRTNLKTDDLRVLKSINFTPMEAWWLDALSSGHILPDYLAWAQKPQEEPWTEIVGSKALYVSFVVWAQQRSIRNIPGDVLFANQLNKFTGVTLKRKTARFVNPQTEGVPQITRTLSDLQNCIYNMPPLKDCREAFEKAVGHKIEWPEDGDDTKPDYVKF